jgi:hypothetical protein
MVTSLQLKPPATPPHESENFASVSTSSTRRPLCSLGPEVLAPSVSLQPRVSIARSFRPKAWSFSMLSLVRVRRELWQPRPAGCILESSSPSRPRLLYVVVRLRQCSAATRAQVLLFCASSSSSQASRTPSSRRSDRSVQHLLRPSLFVGPCNLSRLRQQLMHPRFVLLRRLRASAGRACLRVDPDDPCSSAPPAPSVHVPVPARAQVRPPRSSVSTRASSSPASSASASNLQISSYRFKKKRLSSLTRSSASSTGLSLDSSRDGPKTLFSGRYGARTISLSVRSLLEIRAVGPQQRQLTPTSLDSILY